MHLRVCAEGSEDGAQRIEEHLECAGKATPARMRPQAELALERREESGVYCVHSLQVAEQEAHVLVAQPLACSKGLRV